MLRRRLFALFITCLALAVLGVGMYFLPPVHARLAWRVETLYTRLRYWIRPPDQAVFVPAKVAQNADFTPLPTRAPTLTATVTLTETAEPDEPSATPAPSATLTPSPTPLPERAILKGIRFEYQSFNNCGSANLAMALSFWGWQGDQRNTKAVLRPNDDDANVMPGEMVAYVEQHTDLRAVLRYGGDLDTLRRFLAAGFPVLIESGDQPKGDWWLGHYILVSGYDDAAQQLITQDSLILQDLPVPYKAFLASGWRDFNYAYLVIYPAERAAQVLALLGAEADPALNAVHALEKARAEAPLLQRRDQFFALFNEGSNLLALGQVEEAAAAYDQAYALYAKLDEEKERPWRITWYQTGPYEVYYQAGRYQDVIQLANDTLAWLSKRSLEESHYWRGMAYEALGQKDKAAADYQIALQVRPTYSQAQEALKRVKEQTP